VSWNEIVDARSIFSENYLWEIEVRPSESKECKQVFTVIKLICVTLKKKYRYFSHALIAPRLERFALDLKDIG
jgi:hypothetical protein